MSLRFPAPRFQAQAREGERENVTNAGEAGERGRGTWTSEDGAREAAVCLAALALLAAVVAAAVLLLLLLITGPPLPIQSCCHIREEMKRAQEKRRNAEQEPK